MAAYIIAGSEPNFPFQADIPKVQASFQRLAHVGKCHLSVLEHLQVS